MHVVLLTAEQDAPLALLEVLRAAGMRAAVGARGCSFDADTNDDDEASPRFVLLEVADGAEASELRAALYQAAGAWPGALLLPGRRPGRTETEPPPPRPCR